jgi:pyrimidine operon attenuation protein/uracil phosphoribosyltransferase
MALFSETNYQVDAAALERGYGELRALRHDIHHTTVARPHVVTLGFAETATGLGQTVSDSLHSYYLHSTRHEVAGAASFAGFEEEHSHATDHGLLPTDPEWLRAGGTVVLVDDELSTGKTVINTVTAIQKLIPQEHWVIAALIDLRSPADRARFDELAAQLGTRISVVSLASGSIELPSDVLTRAAALIETLPGAADTAPGSRSASASASASASVVVTVPGVVHHLDCTDLAPVRSARFGTTAPADPAVARAVAERVHALLGVTEASTSDRGVVVVGSEEFIALPMTTADELAALATPTVVRFSTSTRSPIATLDRPDYPIASTVRFRSHDLTTDGVGDRFAYNLTAAGRRFGTVVFMPEPGTDPSLLAASNTSGESASGESASDERTSVLEALRRVSANVIVVILSAADLTASNSSTSNPTDGTATS